MGRPLSCRQLSIPGNSNAAASWPMDKPYSSHQTNCRHRRRAHDDIRDWQTANGTRPWFDHDKHQWRWSLLFQCPLSRLERYARLAVTVKVNWLNLILRPMSKPRNHRVIWNVERCYWSCQASVEIDRLSHQCHAQQCAADAKSLLPTCQRGEYGLLLIRQRRTWTLVESVWLPKWSCIAVNGSHYYQYQTVGLAWNGFGGVRFKPYSAELDPNVKRHIATSGQTYLGNLALHFR